MKRKSDSRHEWKMKSRFRNSPINKSDKTERERQVKKDNLFLRLVAIGVYSTMISSLTYQALPDEYQERIIRGTIQFYQTVFNAQELRNAGLQNSDDRSGK